MDNRNRVRVAVLLVLSGVLLAQSVGVIPLYGAANSWDINTGFSFRPSGTYGLISVNTATSTTEGSFSGEFISLDDISVGGGLSYSSLGFSCSSNSAMNITSISVGAMEYIVTATAGQVSTSKIKFPSKATVEGVFNDDSWTYDSANDVLTVLKTHGGSETITVSFIKGGSGLDDFEKVRSTWMGMFMFFVLIAGIGMVRGISRGSVNINGFWAIIILAVFTAVFMMLLSVTESLWP